MKRKCPAEMGQQLQDIGLTVREEQKNMIRKMLKKQTKVSSKASGVRKVLSYLIR